MTDTAVEAPTRPTASTITDDQLDRLHRERDQYAAAIRHVIDTVRRTAYHWHTTLPETVPSADVTKALNDFARQAPAVPEGLRDDLWQKIVGAYYVVFENDGHPEDSTAAADAAMRVVQPELDRSIGERDRARETAVRLENQLAAVRDLHPGDDSNPAGPWCGTCLTAWPCATAQALVTPRVEHVAGDPDHCPACRQLPAAQVPAILCPGPDGRTQRTGEHGGETA